MIPGSPGYIYIHIYIYTYMYIYRRSLVGYDGELASEWLPFRILPCAVLLALRRCP
jgi:hypothetical protein